MSFRAVFIAIVIGTSLLVAAFMVNRFRPRAVVASAFALGFLMLPFLVRVESSFVPVCAGIMVIEALVGIAGFIFHNVANLDGPSPKTIDDFIYGAPAPMRFPNLALLAGIGLFALRHKKATASSDWSTA